MVLVLVVVLVVLVVVGMIVEVVVAVGSMITAEVGIVGKGSDEIMLWKLRKRRGADDADNNNSNSNQRRGFLSARLDTARRARVALTTILNLDGMVVYFSWSFGFALRGSFLLASIHLPTSARTHGRTDNDGW